MITLMPCLTAASLVTSFFSKPLSLSFFVLKQANIFYSRPFQTLDSLAHRIFKKIQHSRVFFFYLVYALLVLTHLAYSLL